jgi:prepilin-type processing-associated H-X9-DG protein
MDSHATHDTDRRRGRGFTLTELLTVTGLIALLISLFMPVLGKVRAAANSANCLSNVRHIGVAWLGHVAENGGRLPDYVWSTPATPESAYYGYWPGLVDRNGVRGEALRCPAARDPLESPRAVGYGDVSHAWTGRDFKSFTALRLSARNFREGSYGFNRYLSANSNSFGRTGTSCLASVNNLANVPVFFDCAFPDARPVNGTAAVPARPPPNLRGDTLDDRSPEHWRFLLGRHGPGVNVFLADGSARWVRLDEMFQLTWDGIWQPYVLRLPRN